MLYVRHSCERHLHTTMLRLAESLRRTQVVVTSAIRKSVDIDALLLGVVL